jgi:hypothetical protein
LIQVNGAHQEANHPAPHGLAPGAAGTTPTGGAGGTAGAGGSAVASCGAAPYARASFLTDARTSHPTGPITTAASLCPGTSVSFEIGNAQLDVPDKTPLYFMSTQTGSYPSLTPELRLDKDEHETQRIGSVPVYTLLVGRDVDLSTLDPAWSGGTRAAIYVYTLDRLHAPRTPCMITSGITYTVAGHDEAIAVSANGGKSTGSDSDPVILFLSTTGTVASPELVTVLGVRDGCTIVTEGASPTAVPPIQTGNVPVARGATTGPLTAIIQPVN